MVIDLTAKSEQLLSKLANSLYDRDPSFLCHPQTIFFTPLEKQLVQKWLEDMLEEYAA